MNLVDVMLISKTERKPERPQDFINDVSNSFAKFDRGLQIQFFLKVLWCL